MTPTVDRYQSALTAPITGAQTPSRLTPERIIFICRANQGRSPFAAILLAQRLTEQSSQPARYIVISAGTEARESSTVIPHMRTAAAELDIDLNAHRARALDADAIASNHLIITMTEAQRGLVSRMQPRALAKTFTLKEFVRLGTAIEPSRDSASLDDLVRVLHRSRALVAAAPEPEDVRDPGDLGLAATAQVAAEIDELISAVATMLVDRTS